MTPTVYLNKYGSKPLALPSMTADTPFLFGNSIVKSNKADALNTFERNLLSGDNNTTYADKNGVIITEDGPFWP